MSRRALRPPPIALTVALTVALALASCAGGPAETTGPAPVAAPARGVAAPAIATVATADVLPATWELGVPIVEATIDGRGPCRLLLDSGASLLVLSDRFADERGLARVDLNGTEGGVPIDAQGVATRVTQGVRIRELGLGARVYRDTGAVVVDLSAAEQITGARIDGLLPACGFRDALLTIDFGRRTVALSPGELPPADGCDVLTLVGDSCPTVELDVGGAPCPVLLDTGDHGYLAVPAARESSLRFRSRPALVGRHATAAGVFPQRAGRLDATIALGRHRIADPVVSVAQSDYAIAGCLLLAEFRVTFDFGHARVRFERADTAPVTSPPVRNPGCGFLRRDDAWFVAYVLDDGPAARAGLRVGDRVDAIDGRPTSDVSYAEYEEMLALRNSLRLRVTDADSVARGGGDDGGRDRGAARDVAVDVATLVP